MLAPNDVNATVYNYSDNSIHEKMHKYTKLN